MAMGKDRAFGAKQSAGSSQPSSKPSSRDQAHRDKRPAHSVNVGPHLDRRSSKRPTLSQQNQIDNVVDNVFGLYDQLKGQKISRIDEDPDGEGVPIENDKKGGVGSRKRGNRRQ